ATVPRASDYDVVVTVTGPLVDAVTRQKERVLGVWINRSAETFDDVPSAYSVLSNRPVEEIAHPTLLRRFGIGTDYLLPPPGGPEEDADEGADERAEASDADAAVDPEAAIFQSAFLRLRRDAEIYQEVPDAVDVIDNQLFRARATFPADVPLGNFTVRVFLFSGGALLAEERVGILVRKTGFEQLIFSTAEDEPLLYGFLAVLLALFTGWLGGVVFRRA
ncbi:MAG: TIGR02186 family protein, partial [Devosiaceae bacterium]|nr:TIGR02186 family protein [Devosiaceae bacterium MH13]